MQSEDLSDYQKQIIKAVVDGSIETISYKNPSADLGKILENDDIHNAMRGLDDRGMIELKSSGFLFFNKSYYEVDPEKAREAYNSFKED